LPYSTRQQQYLTAMGVVPWVLRDSPSRRGAVHGPDSAQLLLVFDSTGQEDKAVANVELTNREATLLRDMLSAIKVQEKSVGRCALAHPDTRSDHAKHPLAQHCGANFYAILLVVQQALQISSDDAAASRVPTPELSAPVWLLPHPSWLLQEPRLKRRAWNVLKAVHEQLPEASQSAE